MVRLGSDDEAAAGRAVPGEVVAVKFEIKFLTPYRVASGRAGDGADATVDRSVPLPASSLKGVMRSAARDLLELSPTLVKEVFGTGWSPSPWSWSDACPANDSPDPLDIRLRARIQIDADTGTVRDGALAVAEEIHSPDLVFTVTRTGWIEGGPEARQRQILLASARAVTSLGGDRRRGLGWVAVTPVDPPWATVDVDDLVAALSRARASA
jgi:CRISPR/Cas system CMR subunit Cmr4 (Cas7 group RAMP superfamily)